MTTTYPWAAILSHMTPTKWEWECTGGGCMALTTTTEDGRYLMITDGGLTDGITPTEPVLLGIYSSPDTAHDGEGIYHEFPNMGELLAEIGGLIG